MLIWHQVSKSTRATVHYAAFQCAVAATLLVRMTYAAASKRVLSMSRGEQSPMVGQVVKGNNESHQLRGKAQSPAPAPVACASHEHSAEGSEA